MNLGLDNYLDPLNSGVNEDGSLGLTEDEKKQLFQEIENFNEKKDEK